MLAILSENSEAITAIATIIISSIAVIISIITYKGQKKLTIQSARPFLSFNLVDLSDRISIEVENNGLGVAIIKSTSFGSMSSGQVKDSLIDLVESIDDTDNPCFDDRTIWKRYEEGLCKKAIAPQSKRYLLELTSKDSSELARLREILSEIEVRINYTSIYENDSHTLNENLGYYRKNL